MEWLSSSANFRGVLPRNYFLSHLFSISLACTKEEVALQAGGIGKGPDLSRPSHAKLIQLF